MSAEQLTLSTTTAKIIYILLIISPIIVITGIIALIMMYMNNDDTDNWLQTHYRFQIRTFWIGFLYFAVGAILSPVIIGYPIMLFTFFWLIIRCAKGLKQLGKHQPVQNLESWLFT